MKSSRLIFKLFAIIAFAQALVLPASAQNVPAAFARYVLSLEGHIIASATVKLAGGQNIYEIDLTASVAGLGQIVANGSAKAKVSGTTNASSYLGNSFSLNTKTGDGNSNVEVRYEGTNVTSFVIEPPLPPRLDQIPIERKQLNGVTDGLSAFILKAKALGPEICNRKVKVFTGYERFDLKFSYVSSETATSKRTGYQGPVVLCHLDYTPVSGHYESSEITNFLTDSDRLLIWYAPVGQSGTFIPYRVLIGTAMGDLSMVLTELNSNS